MIPACTAIILAGGHSRRMGRDKASLPLKERPLLIHVAEILTPLFSQVFVSVQKKRNDISLPQIEDPVANSGPLAGVIAGLQYTKTPWIFVCATDMPLLNPALIKMLAARRHEAVDAIVPCRGVWTETLCAFYAKSALPSLTPLLSLEKAPGLRAALRSLRVDYVPEAQLRESDPDLHNFMDLDTPEDISTFLKTAPIRD